MIWFKKNDPAAVDLPLLVVMSGGSAEWQMFNYPANDELFANFANTGLYAHNVVNTLSWNNMALRVSSNQIMFINLEI